MAATANLSIKPIWKARKLWLPAHGTSTQPSPTWSMTDGFVPRSPDDQGTVGIGMAFVLKFISLKSPELID